MTNKMDKRPEAAFKVFRVYPHSWEDIEALAEIRKFSEEENEVIVRAREPRFPS